MHDFRKEVTEHNVCVVISSNSCRKRFYSKMNWAKYDQKMFIGLHVKYPLFLLDFNEARNISTDFRKIFKYKIA
jgi:hypothetical protein